MALRGALIRSWHVAAAVAVALGVFALFGTYPAGSSAQSGSRQHTVADWYEAWPAVLTYGIAQDCDDGTEVDSTWYAGGHTAGVNKLGRDVNTSFTVGLRFAVPDLKQGQTVKYTRLRLAAQGGYLTSCAHLLIRGVDEDSPETFSYTRIPSALAKVPAAVSWDVAIPWVSPGDNLGLRYSSPDLASIINEILSRPNWGQGAEGRTLILTIEDGGCPAGEANHLSFEDYSMDPALRDEAILEIYPTLADAFVGKPMLGTPMDTSVTVNMISLLSLDVYAEYGTVSGIYPHSTSPLIDQPAGEPIDLTIGGLLSDTAYYYRIRYREVGDSVYLAGMEGRFHTQRACGSEYIFTVQADSHMWPLEYSGDVDGLRLYEQAIENIGLDQPDFHISLGDFVHVGCYTRRDVLNMQEAVEKYLGQRKYLDKILHSAPFYLVLGNHEGEQGWRVADPADSVAIWGTLARKMVVANPVPNGFYSGNGMTTDCCSLRENYYSWEWGDALFVVLDPFWYTTTKPHSIGEGEGSENAWDWTLGEDQYNWLYDTLHNSCSTWKFVFVHHLVGGLYSPVGMLTTPYGRGGIEAGKHKVDGRASFEWGGEDGVGDYAFPSRRPGWGHGSIHDMMVDEGVTILFHGHDHLFAHQVLDEVVYQLCPQPSDCDYGDGWCGQGCYGLGSIRNNSGHLRVTVKSDYVQVDYVRSVLPEDEPLLESGMPIYNRQVSYSYSIGTAGAGHDIGDRGPPRLLGNTPNPFGTETGICLYLPEEASISLRVYNVEGRLIRVLFAGTLREGRHTVQWDTGSDGDRPLDSGVYFYRLRVGNIVDTGKAVLLR